MIPDLFQVCFFHVQIIIFPCFVIYHELKTVLKLHYFLVADKSFIWGEEFVGGGTLRLARYGINLRRWKAKKNLFFFFKPRSVERKKINDRISHC